MPRTGQPAARRIATVGRAFAVLDALADGGRELGTNEIARRTGVNASTVSRLLATLVEVGVVEHVRDSGRYRLGLRLLELSSVVLARLDVREVARPQLRRLVQATGETATLSAPGERTAITVDYVQSPSSVQSVARLGRPGVLHATATGKVMLAFGRAAVPTGRLPRYSERTIATREALVEEIERVRGQGWARALGEREPELNAIAAPILNDRRELAAIVGLQGPASRFTGEAVRRALDELLRSAAAVSRALGGS